MAVLTFTSLDVHLQIGHFEAIGIGRPAYRHFGRVASGTGSGPCNDLLYEDRKVSYTHCTIIKCKDDDPTTVRLFDEGSKNGTYLNGVRIYNDHNPIRQGDVITPLNPRHPHHDIRINSIRISQPNEPRVAFRQICVPDIWGTE